MEEMGMRCELNKVFDFIYKAKMENDLYEHEFDHVLFGYSDELPEINKKEVEGYTYKSLHKIQNEIVHNPEIYTEWFKICFKEVVLRKKTFNNVE